MRWFLSCEAKQVHACSKRDLSSALVRVTSTEEDLSSTKSDLSSTKSELNSTQSDLSSALVRMNLTEELLFSALSSALSRISTLESTTTAQPPCKEKGRSTIFLSCFSHHFVLLFLCFSRRHKQQRDFHCCPRRKWCQLC